MSNISDVLLKRMKYESIVTNLSNIYDSFVDKPLTTDTLNKLEVEAIMYLNTLYNDPYYDNEVLDSIKKIFYDCIYVQVKDQINRYK